MANLRSKFAQQQKEIEALSSGLAKASAQLEANKLTQKVVAKDQ